MGRGGGTAGPCTLSRRASPASRLCMPRPPGECQMALIGKGHTLYKGEIQGGGSRGREGAPNKVERQSAETYRSMGTGKQKERRCRVGTGVKIGGQQGSNEGGQVNRPMPHVSMKDTREIKGKNRKVSQHRATKHGTKEGKTRGQAEGSARRARAMHGRNGQQQRRGTQNQAEGEGSRMKYKERKMRGTRKRGGRKGATRDGDVEKK